MDQGWEIAEPRADALIESLRAFGYSAETAIADLVDNSISAGAKHVSVDFSWAGALSTVCVMDDGRGMSESALTSAMRPGSRSPLDARDPSDLGRFGLGLKTASFSQARELTVLSIDSASGAASTRRWDLDTVAATREWRLLTSPPSTKALPSPESAHGTVVLWSKVDRLVGDADATDAKAHNRFLAITKRVQQHLEATFARFLSLRSPVHITVNGPEIIPWDPFLSEHPATQPLEVEFLSYRDHVIKVSPYVLPHRSKLDEQEASRGAGIRGWNQQQGFYVYRSDRLLVQGDWLGLGISKDEHAKLARIAIEFPPQLDHEWQVDVKKSQARPPGELMESLRRIALATNAKAERVYRHRGKIVSRRNSHEFVFAWHETKLRDGEVKYTINRNHPVIAALLEAADDKGRFIEKALRFVEETIPTPMIGISVAQSIATGNHPFDGASSEIMKLIDFTYTNLIYTGSSPADAMDRVSTIEPFLYFPDELLEYRRSLT